MKKIYLIIFLVLVVIIYQVTSANAQQNSTTKSNGVTTRVGNPAAPIPGSSDAVITCPLSKDGAGSFTITCGTANNPVNQCGHAGIGYPLVCNPKIYACTPSGQYRDQLKAAIDVRPTGSNGGNAPVYLPFIDGNQEAQWNKVSGPIDINGGSWGIKLEYVANLNGKTYRIDLTHLDKSYNQGANKSGDQVGVTKPGVDGGSAGHLHTAVSIDDTWLDSISQAHLCTQ